ncbi:hypothetical protein GQ53DRAFT_816991 [Thozetella sp. PMI_491]|nr:hypothetical protein GQ53DRAFT_816991 [Thozetella sp. PMI_491]
MMHPRLALILTSFVAATAAIDSIETIHDGETSEGGAFATGGTMPTDAVITVTSNPPGGATMPTDAVITVTSNGPGAAAMPTDAVTTITTGRSGSFPPDTVITVTTSFITQSTGVLPPSRSGSGGSSNLTTNSLGPTKSATRVSTAGGAHATMAVALNVLVGLVAAAAL